MSILIAGLSYRKTPLDLIERFAFEDAELGKGLAALTSMEHVGEAAILATCNRVEVYAVVSGYHTGLAAVRRFLSEFHGVAVDEFSRHLYAYFQEDAVAHLFSVASGIDSMVVGEPQILTQVRRAFQAAREEGTVGPILEAFMRSAIKVGRRARRETRISRSGSTLANAGATIAREVLGGSLAGRTILVAGAGKMSELAAWTASREGATVLVANRTAARAHSLAERIGGEAVAMHSLAGALLRADVVISSTASPHPVFTKAMVEEAMRTRSGRALAMIDLAVPRDIDPGAAEVPGVTLRDLDGLREAVRPEEGYGDEVARVRDIVAEESSKFLKWQRAHRLSPLLQALQSRADGVRTHELERASSVLAGLDDRERQAVDTLTRSIVAKLLHAPVVRVKSKAGSQEGDALVRALVELFDLDARSDEYS